MNLEMDLGEKDSTLDKNTMEFAVSDSKVEAFCHLFDGFLFAALHFKCGFLGGFWRVYV